jgi:plastocyanin
VKPALSRREPKERRRRRPWRVTVAASAGTVTLAACGGASAGSYGTARSATTTPSRADTQTKAATVGIANFAFGPAALTLKVGTPVVWTNNDTIAHTVNFTTEHIDSSVLNKGDQFTHTFNTPGTYDYICSIHPFMHGSVTVTP